MKVTDWLDLGVGVSSQYADAKLATAYPNLSPALPDGVSQLSGDGWDFGWSASAQAYLGQGDAEASYRSKVKHDLDGNVLVMGLVGPLAGANMNAGGSAFTTPWIAHPRRRAGRPPTADPERPGATDRLGRVRRHRCGVPRRRRDPGPGLQGHHLRRGRSRLRRQRPRS